jgi:hypothetical protein
MGLARRSLPSANGAGLRALLLFRYGDRLAALSHDEGENLGRLGLAAVAGYGVQLAGRLIERLALGQEVSGP